MYTYKVITLKLTRMFEKEDLEDKINTEAVNGWRVSQSIPLTNMGNTIGFKILFEKEI